MVSKLADLKIQPKLIILFVLTGILPLLIAGYYGSKLASTALMEASFNQLAAIQTIRTGQLESVFKQRAQNLKRLSRFLDLRHRRRGKSLQPIWKRSLCRSICIMGLTIDTRTMSTTN